jgi:hypothetical protein
MVSVFVVGLFVLRNRDDDASDQQPDGGSRATSGELAVSTGKVKFSSPADNDDFLGSSACAECHPKIARAYSSHPMANSLWKVSEAPVVEEYTKETRFSPDTDHHYSVRKSVDEILHHERMTDTEGKTLYDQAVRVDYAVGSGAMGRSYLIDRSGLLFMSPISWYTSSRRWDLSPGYRLPHHRRFDRRIQAECVNCHAGRLNTESGSDRRFQQPPFAELSIGCERCHGPGKQHVEVHRAESNGHETDPIVNPLNLDAARREDLCAQCHLQGRGRIPHYGCEVTDFRPGQRLEETCTIFVEAESSTSIGRVRAVSQVEQMRSSACYRGSEGRLGCISCHEIHPTSTSPATYREKCLNCHNEKGCQLPVAERIRRQPDDSCVECHMPSGTGSQIPHAAFTNHQILRTPDTSTEEAGNPVFVVPTVFDGADSRLSRLVVNRARGLWLADHAESTTNRTLAEHAVQLLLSVTDQIPNDADVLDALGTASAVSGRLDDSLKYWERAISIEPDRDQTFRTMAILLQNSSKTEEARRHMETYLELQPWDAVMWGRKSLLLGRSGEWKEAIDAAEQSRSLNPSDSRIYRWLAECYREIGDTRRSQEYSELFDRIRLQSAE